LLLIFLTSYYEPKALPMFARGPTNGSTCITASAMPGTSINGGTEEVDPSSSNRRTSTKESQRVLADAVSYVNELSNPDESES